MSVVILFLIIVLIIVLSYISIGIIFFSDFKENLLTGDILNLIYYTLLSIFWPITIIVYVFIVVITFISIIFIMFFKKMQKIKKGHGN